MLKKGHWLVKVIYAQIQGKVKHGVYQNPK